MISEISTLKVTPGNMPKAQQWAGKIVVRAKELTPDCQMHLLRPISGDFDGEIVFLSLVPSLADFEQMQNKRREDAAWQALVKEFRESNISISLTRAIYNVV